MKNIVDTIHDTYNSIKLNRTRFKMNKLLIENKIGSGNSCEIYSAYYLPSNTKLALKTSFNKSRLLLKNEFGVYKNLSIVTSDYLPTVYAYGTLMINNNLKSVMAMELLDKSLKSKLLECGNKFSYKTSLMLIDMMLCRVKFLHDNNYIHCDIKPDNFMFSLSDPRKLYLIDYGLAQKYGNPKSQISDERSKHVKGTIKYCSLNSHYGKELSRRDDLETLGYVFIYFLKGKLPWQKPAGITKHEKTFNIMKCKEQIQNDELCVNLSINVYHFIQYVRTLKINEEPKYSYLRNLILDEMKKNNYVFDYQFDWMK